jgi:hypothetical protein
MAGAGQKADDSADGPFAITLPTAKKTKADDEAAASKASHPANARRGAVSSVTTAPPTQIKIAAKTACSGVIIFRLTSQNDH